MNLILFRKSLVEKEELDVAKKYFSTTFNRTAVGLDDLIIGRYSCLPYYKELESDLKIVGAKLINSFQEHQYVADLQNWYDNFENITPKTWFRLEDVPKNEIGPFVLKGETNSRKFEWDSHMFAENRNKATDVYIRLQQDGLIGFQKIYIRKYIPLKTYYQKDVPHNLPITKEFRFFILDNKVLAGGYYWTNYVDQLTEDGHLPDPREVPEALLQDVIKRVDGRIRFYVVDVAQDIFERWWVIELNDGQMSGLCNVNPETLYKNLLENLS